MSAEKYADSVAVTRDIHWVGFSDKEASLYCNPYLLLDEDDIVFFDPGSIPDFPIVMRKVIDIVSPEDINYIVASHQDPDICGSLAVVEDVINNPELQIISHINTTRLIRHHGLKSSYYDLDENNYKLTLKSGRTLEFLHSAYLHSPGSIATYDKKTKTFFSSDLFGAISSDWSLFAKGDYLEGIKLFHELYMPTNSILRKFMQRLEKYDIQRIAPQHGSVLEGEQVKEAINMLKELPVGIDLL